MKERKFTIQATFGGEKYGLSYTAFGFSKRIWEETLSRFKREILEIVEKTNNSYIDENGNSCDN